ncbi:AbrB/MazE/SpoVT family DNA-binding domain-containing protein [Bifidobacterium amazonense]|uniref:AbrB/MazE/SpoVT family DNA-binding domain-containing protein n=1 Tax=Bifidobacterium amazonense TaxID=2809027 RepID=A0ABS9VTD6_9BIFI|nr:AbrB/MazE/SpoVT family DNA-binding domain-containing protein [Bifidobacterium amazonense]MCH9275343.1 AbrB/MazE/SpoVT family DNA-binding domain-containing protein [Bifidobacterium amazonense]
MVKATVNKWGNALGVRIPKEIREQLELHEGSHVDINVDGNRIVITPERQRITRIGRYNVPDLHDLFAGYDGRYTPHEDGFTSPVGKERL